MGFGILVNPTAWTSRNDLEVWGVRPAPALPCLWRDSGGRTRSCGSGSHGRAGTRLLSWSICGLVSALGPWLGQSAGELVWLALAFWVPGLTSLFRFAFCPLGQFFPSDLMHLLPVWPGTGHTVSWLLLPVNSLFTCGGCPGPGPAGGGACRAWIPLGVTGLGKEEPVGPW